MNNYSEEDVPLEEALPLCNYELTTWKGVRWYCKLPEHLHVPDHHYMQRMVEVVV